MANFPAHIRMDKDGVKRYQSTEEHCRNTAKYAADALKAAELYHTGQLAGLIHDVGKNQRGFSEYLEKSADGEKVTRGSVNHTFAGVRWLLEKYHGEPPLEFDSLSAELIAYAAGAHHGLFDCVDENGRDGFYHRLTKDGISYEESRDNFLKRCADESEMDGLFRKSVSEITKKLNSIVEICLDDSEVSFYGGLLARLILSAVIDGDRRDTAEFKSDIKYTDFPDDMRKIWNERLDCFLGKLAALPNETPIQKSRRKFSSLCAALSEKPVGIYRINLPTGAGKTLASMRAALSCAAKQNKRRIVYAIPLLSILDQNAKTIHDYIGDDALILEHHSNVMNERRGEDRDKHELLAENWSRPIVITTLVQLLNTLFCGRISAIRRMQALCGSVLVIDEVQSVPIRLLSLFNLAMNFLVKVCGVTVLLCSATQPCFENTDHPLYCTPEELVPYAPEEWEVFRRTKISAPKNIRLSEVGSFLVSELTGSTLIVCNTKREASEIYSQLKSVERYHLSASMCMKHRESALEKIKRAIREERNFVCVSTQLIEAGVDISFKNAVRIMAGLDNILQTAGRCNRNGESAEPAEVKVLRCVDENLTFLKDIKAAQNASEALFEAFSREPQAFSGDIASDEAVNYYYKKLYTSGGEKSQDGPLEDGTTLYSLFSNNEKYAAKCVTAENYWLRQAFHEAGESFTVFEQDTVDVVVPYGGGKKVISDLCSERAAHDLGFLSDALNRAKPFTVSIFKYQKDFLTARSGLTERNGVYVINEGWYDDKLGLIAAEPKSAEEEG